MDDDRFFELGTSGVGFSGGEGVVSPPVNNPSPAQSQPEGVVERKMFTITTFRQYPNGEMYISNTKSWFDKNSQVIKKKEKKVVKTEQAVLQKEETY